MSRSLFWLSDEAWAAIELHLPKNQPEARWDDRRVILGIIHMLKFWADYPSEYGLSTTIYNRWIRRASERASWQR